MIRYGLCDADPDLSVLLDSTAYGPGTEVGDETWETVTWDANRTSITYRLTDPSLAPVEVNWMVSGIGDAAQPCGFPWIGCDDTKNYPSLVIDAPPDEFGPDADLTIAFPSPTAGQWTIAEAIIRFDPASTPRLRFPSESAPRVATTEYSLDGAGGQLLPMSSTANCGDPCELSLWVSYHPGMNAATYDVFGEAELVEVRTHELVETPAPDLVLELNPETTGTQFLNFCIRSGEIITTPVDAVTTFFVQDTVFNPGSPPPADQFPIVASVRDGCITTNNTTSTRIDDEIREQFETLTVFGSIFTVADRAPDTIELITIER